jgi:hypothetical protein
MHVRDATVGPLFGTTAVSGCQPPSSRSMPRASDDLREDRIRALPNLGIRRQHAHALRVASTVTTDAR